jgi:CheY-like chemotaxis protein
MKVLIVEDHPDMRNLLGIIVERLGYLPVLANEGEEGVEKAIAEKPNLILLDMMMPKMDGRKVARRLRANPETKEIRSWQSPRLAVLTISTLVCWRAATATSSSHLALGIFRQRFENC